MYIYINIIDTAGLALSSAGNSLLYFAHSTVKKEVDICTGSILDFIVTSIITYLE